MILNKENEWISVKELTNAQTAIKKFHHSNSNAPWLTIKIRKMSTDFEDAPCICPICLQISIPTPSPLFQMLECKELQQMYNKYNSSFFEFTPVE